MSTNPSELQVLESEKIIVIIIIIIKNSRLLDWNYRRSKRLRYEAYREKVVRNQIY